MRADNSRHLLAATRRRSAATHKRAVAALHRLDEAGTPISFDAIAREAGVSRSWLNNRPDLRAEIERLRPSAQLAARPTVPARQRASDASLQRRLELAGERIRQLDGENVRLRQALAEALGEHRVAGSRRPPADGGRSR